MATKRKGTSPTRNLMVEIPEDVWRALKLHAVQHDLLMKDIVTDLLRKYLKMGVKEGE
jgi:hypothetical protein